MSVSIVQAPRASEPYPWGKFSRWLAEQGLSGDEIQEILENGSEPAVTHAIGFTLDESEPYPGLPSLDGLTLDSEPGVNIRGGAVT